MKLDQDLQSIQEVRNFLQEAKQAQKLLEKMSQAQVDIMVEGIAKAAEKDALRLAAMAVEETGFGKAEDKRIKNLFAAQEIYAAIKDMKTVGIINRDEIKRVWEIAQPVGIVAGIVPSTNPTSTTIFKSLIALKARNAIIFSPHPSAAKCTLETVRILQEAVEHSGAPKGLIHCITNPTLAAANELMTHKLTDVILSTGGTGIVKAAYSSGKPAYGVGPGNVPVYVHHSANLQRTVKLILESKTFDYGTICASEQAIVADQSIKQSFIEELKKQGAYFLNQQEKEKVAAIIMSGQGLNPKMVGRSPQKLAEMAGIDIPADVRVLVAEEQNIGREYPFSVEKLSPILAFYTVQNWQDGCDTCLRLLELGGMGHTLGIHCEEEPIIEAFGLEKPASRIIVNAGTTFGGIGLSTGIFPSLTLGCGSFGNNITSDNIGPQHLMNIKRVAFGIKEVNQFEEVRKDSGITQTHGTAHLQISREEILEIIKSVLSEMKS